MGGKKVKVPVDKRGHSRKVIKREHGIVGLQMDSRKNGERQKREWWRVTTGLIPVSNGKLEKILKHNKFIFSINPSSDIMGNKLKEKD